MPTTTWNRAFGGGMLSLALLVGWTTASRAADNEEGRGLYLKYCSACHGATGKGDGVVSQAMRPAPIDLTDLAKKAGGTFPVADVAGRIDGRDTSRVHGDPDMPVWGEVLSDKSAARKSAEQAATSKIVLITEYLNSIQVK